jgi:hypothetical protein
LNLDISVPEKRADYCGAVFIYAFEKPNPPYLNEGVSLIDYRVQWSNIITKMSGLTL